MADAEQQVVTNTEQQVTSKTPATKQKNPKRVAAGKAVAERTRIAREAQRKAFIEAQSIIARAKPPDSPYVAEPPSADPAEPPSADPPSVAEPPSAEPTKKLLTTTQWLSVASIVISLAGLYYKREEIKKLLTKKAPPTSPVLPPPSPKRAPAIRQMD